LKRYSFSYAPQPTKKGIIYRPVAQIFLQSIQEKWYAFEAYIDSGADISLFRRTDAELLGLNLRTGEYHPMMGIGKTLVPAYKHKIKLRIEDTVLEAFASFADSDEVPRLLGRTDVFNHFRITFDEAKLKIIFEN
jgi:hypothetical protein